MMPTRPAAPSTAIWYLVAAVVIVVAAIGGIVAVFIARPENDNAAIVAAIITLTMAVIPSVLALMKAQETHVAVNSKLDKWMADAEAAARAEGAAAGVAEGHVQANARTDELAAAKKQTPPMKQ